ncbi:MAG TPA: Holliday junction branch migration protein RuvA [Nocardioidaceae bacterium]|nr:Holliday junction branch migration protein RuvA [Nocardioidaceae bacterium]
MIAFIRGHVAEVSLDSAVIEVGGLGIQVLCAPATLAGLRVGEPVRLPTSMVVREDSLTLFGFADDDERVLFELLQTASGVGPRLAQAMLAVHGPDALRRAVATEDLVGLTAVPGIGRKGAQRIVLELKDRIGAVPATPSPVESSRGSAWREQVRGALLGLGWSVREADAAVEAVAEQAVEPPDVPALLRAALRTLSRA